MANDAPTFSTHELQEALRAIESTLRKCEKVQPRLRPGSAQHTLLVRRIRALAIATALIQKELGASPADPSD